MKREKVIIAWAIALTIVFVYLHNTAIDRLEDEIDYLEQELTKVSNTPKATYDCEWQMFIQALIITESQMNSKAIGDDGTAVGILQIHPIMVREYNRITGTQETINRKDPIQSLKVFNTIQAFHNPEKDQRRACEIWNPGGGNGYYIRVMKNMNKLLLTF